MIELTALTYFTAVYETKNMTLASERLFVTRQAISKSLRQLEASFGTRLFIAQRSGVTFTPQGDCLYQHAVRLLAELNSLNQAMDKIHREQYRTLRIGFGQMTYNLYIGAIEQFKAQHPELEIAAEASSPGELFSRLQEGKLDLVISSTRCTLEGIDAKLLFERPLFVVMCSDDPLAEANDLDVRALSGRIACFPPELSVLRDDFAAFCQRESLDIVCNSYQHSDLISILQELRQTHTLFISSGNFTSFFHLQDSFIMRRLTSSLKTPMPNKNLCAYTLRDHPDHPNKDKFVQFLLASQNA